jgi:hypothetical protein
MLGIKMSERDARCAMKFVVLLREKGNEATLREIEAIPFAVETEIKMENASKQNLQKMELLPQDNGVQETK